MRYFFISLTAALICGFPSVVRAQEAVAPHPAVTLPPELDRVLRDYETGWRNGDAAGLAQLFTPDGFVMSPERPPVRGRETIEARYANAGGELRLRALDYAIDGNVGFIIGGYTYRDDGVDTGKFILALRRDSDGRWLIAADMDSSN